MLEQTWDFPHQGFHSYCTCQRIILPLSPTPDPGAEKIPHILHNLLQHVPAVTANNTPISSGSRQTAPSAAIWVPARHFQTLLLTRPEKSSTICPRLIPSPLSLDCQEARKRSREMWMNPQEERGNLHFSAQG